MSIKVKIYSKLDNSIDIVYTKPKFVIEELFLIETDYISYRLILFSSNSFTKIFCRLY